MNYLFCKKDEKLRIDPVSLLSLKCFTWELEKDAFWCMVLFHEVKRLKNNSLVLWWEEEKYNWKYKYKHKEKSKGEDCIITFRYLFFEIFYLPKMLNRIFISLCFSGLKEKSCLIIVNKWYGISELHLSLAEFVGEILDGFIFLCDDGACLFVESHELCDSSRISYRERLRLFSRMDYFMLRWCFFILIHNYNIVFFTTCWIHTTKYLNIILFKEHLLPDATSTNTTSLYMAINSTRWYSETSCSALSIKSKRHNKSCDNENEGYIIKKGVKSKKKAKIDSYFFLTLNI